MSSWHIFTQVRAANLQELVYKQGQAGVQKASVTLIFDNQDKENSPLGYEQNTEITVTRQVCASDTSARCLAAHSALRHSSMCVLHCLVSVIIRRL